MDTESFDPWAAPPSFELADDVVVSAKLELAHDLVGLASWNLNDQVLLGGYVAPRKILFVGGGSDQWPSMRMGVEVIGGEPQCMLLQLANNVRPKHLKATCIEQWVTDILMASVNVNVSVSETNTLQIHQPDLTRDDRRAVEKLQRRRRDPRSDRALLERVAEVYRTHPGAPNKAVAAEFGVSERTAARWAEYCSDAELLARAPRQGQKRL